MGIAHVVDVVRLAGDGGLDVLDDGLGDCFLVYATLLSRNNIQCRRTTYQC